MRRVLLRERAERLRRRDLAWVTLSTFELVDAESVVLSARAVTTGLLRPPWFPDAIALVAATREAQVDEDAIAARLAGYNMLKRRAKRGLDELAPHPGPDPVDRIETDLRWAGALVRAVVADGLTAAVRRLEMTLGRSVDELPVDLIERLLRLARAVACAEAEVVDPSRGQRYLRRCDQAIDRALAAMDVQRQPARASARREGRTLVMPDLLHDLVPWERDLGLRRDLEPLVRTLDEDAGAIVIERYGLSGDAPRTMAELAIERGTSALIARRAVGRAEAMLRTRARANLADGTDGSPPGGAGA